MRRLSSITRYNRYLFDKFSNYSGKRVLEVESGIGNITHLLIKNRDILISVDKVDTYIAKLLLSIPESSIFKALVYDIEKDSIDILNKFKFDTIICINVLEHIQDDQASLVRMNKVLNKEGRIILIIPAQKWLFSEFEARAGHFRRYTEKEIR